jgi:hypothetical protein
MEDRNMGTKGSWKLTSQWPVCRTAKANDILAIPIAPTQFPAWISALDFTAKTDFLISNPKKTRQPPICGFDQ